MSRIVPLRTRRIRKAISLTRDQCERITDAARPLAPVYRPEFVTHIERKLREGVSISGVLLKFVDAPLGKLRVEVYDD